LSTELDVLKDLTRSLKRQADSDSVSNATVALRMISFCAFRPERK
jgi:hypothetical protein